MLDGHQEEVVAGEVQPPRGDNVVTASFDGTARVWDAGTGAACSSCSDGAPPDRRRLDPSGTPVVTASLGVDPEDPTLDLATALPGSTTARSAASSTICCSRCRDYVTRGLTVAERQEFLEQ